MTDKLENDELRELLVKLTIDIIDYDQRMMDSKSPLLFTHKYIDEAKTKITELFAQSQLPLLEELKAEMPKPHTCNKICKNKSVDWQIIHKAMKDSEQNILLEVTALLDSKLNKGEV